MLSAAKHLASPSTRFFAFAEFTLNEMKGPAQTTGQNQFDRVLRSPDRSHLDASKARARYPRRHLNRICVNGFVERFYRLRSFGVFNLTASRMSAFSAASSTGSPS